MKFVCLIAYRAGTFGAIFEYGAEKKVSRHSSLGATMSIGVPTGVSLKIRSVVVVYLFYFYFGHLVLVFG